MAVAGGYIVVGADNHGRPTGRPINAAAFDEARLAAKVRQFLDDIHILTNVFEQRCNVLIYIGPHRAGVAVFKRIGQYGQNSVVFREGEIFHRRGTESRRIDTRSLQEALERVVDRRVREEIDRLAPLIRRELERAEFARSASSIAREPLGALTIGMTADVIANAVLELARTSDDIPFRRLLDEARERARIVFPANEQPLLADTLDKLTTMACALASVGREAWAAATVDALVDIYALALDSYGHDFAHTLQIAPDEPRVAL